MDGHTLILYSNVNVLRRYLRKNVSHQQDVIVVHDPYHWTSFFEDVMPLADIDISIIVCYKDINNKIVKHLQEEYNWKQRVAFNNEKEEQEVLNSVFKK